MLAVLPAEIRDRANDSFLQFSIDPHHSGLRFKKVHSTKPIFSARVTLDYRVEGIACDDMIVWFWIGKHSDYEKLLGNL